MTDITVLSLIPDVKKWLDEDDLGRNLYYSRMLPEKNVELRLKIKSPLILTGTDYFIATFVSLGASYNDFKFLKELEGKFFKTGEEIVFPNAVPFSLAVTAERLALNLVQHASSITTWTKQFVEKSQIYGIKVLDTRKTTPGLRALEKYATRVAGAYNHRFGQSDVWMIKDNHKACLGGLKGAYNFFVNQQTFYNPIIAEIHNTSELAEAIEIGIKHVMLDNFLSDDISLALKMKKPGMTYEVSGGIRIDTIQNYLIEGIDALSIGSLTNGAPKVDISLKYRSK